MKRNQRPFSFIFLVSQENIHIAEGKLLESNWQNMKLNESIDTFSFSWNQTFFPQRVITFKAVGAMEEN